MIKVKMYERNVVSLPCWRKFGNNYHTIQTIQNELRKHNAYYQWEDFCDYVWFETEEDYVFFTLEWS